MCNYSRDDLDAKALKRLLCEKQIEALSDLVDRGSEMLFDAVAGEGCWQGEFTEEERRVIRQRIIVRMVGELFKPEEPGKSRSSMLH